MKGLTDPVLIFVRIHVLILALPSINMSMHALINSYGCGYEYEYFPSASVLCYAVRAGTMEKANSSIYGKI